MQDQVNHPTHYNNHPSRIQCIEVTQFMSFTLGNAFKYLFRADQKNGEQDYRKALWYLNRELDYRRGGCEPITLYRPNRHATVVFIAAADPRPEVATAMLHIGNAAFKHTGTSDLECAVQEIEKWLKNSNA